MALVYNFVVLCITILGALHAEDEINCNLVPLDLLDSKCCRSPKFFDDNLYLECWKEWGNRNGSLIPGAGIAGGPGGCVAECAIKKLGGYENDALKKEAALEMVKANLQTTDPQFKQVMHGIEYCFDAANSRQQRFLDIKKGPEMVVGQPNCNPISGFMMDCMERYMLRECPEKEWLGGMACKKLKSFFDACPLEPI